MEQQDRRAIEAAAPVYRWLAEHEHLYHGQESAARVLLLGRDPRTGRGGGNAYRGFFRLLSEQHIPFAVGDNLDWLGERDFDLVIAAHWVAGELEEWVRQGGRLLIASPTSSNFGPGAPAKMWTGIQGYFRIRDHARFPSLRSTDILMMNGDYAEFPPSGASPLTLIPPSMFGPPERVHLDMVEKDKPLRVSSSVVHFSWLRLTAALWHAIARKAHVVSMSARRTAAEPGAGGGARRGDRRGRDRCGGGGEPVALRRVSGTL